MRDEIHAKMAAFAQQMVEDLHANARLVILGEFAVNMIAYNHDLRAHSPTSKLVARLPA